MKKPVPKIEIYFSNEDAKYEGKPLVKPRIPYKTK